MSARSFTGRRAQQGVSLIIAIIILGAMMLSGVAMFRKLAASAMISGNLTFTNSAIAGADSGQEVARDWLMNQTGSALFAACPGYFPAHCYNDQTDVASATNCNASATPSRFDPFTYDWEGTNQSILVTDTDGDGDDDLDAAGNSVRYVVHRLCDRIGSIDASGQSCVLALQTGGGSGGHGTITYGTQQLSTTMRPYYRITTRVRGPRNAVAFTQTTKF